MNPIELLRELCQLDAPSGREDAVREWIMARLAGKAEFRVDPLGNLLVQKRGKMPAKRRVMLSAHMDEVGFIVTHVEEDGTLRFSPVGGIDARVCFGKRVRLNGIPGVVAGKPIHQIGRDERGDVIPIVALRIDIGAKNAEQAKKYVSPGDTAVWDTEFEEWGGSIKARALDDRAGCALLLALLLSETPETDLTVAFTVQEEVGLRGAAAAAYSLAPDAAIVVECTTAADVAGVEPGRRVCALGAGPAISFMDGHTIYDRELYRLAFQTAEEAKLPCQPKAAVAGGNDAGAIHVSRGGVPTAAVSLPCRYLHSPAGIISRSDLDAALPLIRALSAKAALR